MSEQEVFNMLSELEEYFYYRKQNPLGIPWETVNKMHGELRALLCQWAAITGCRNE